ncbi:MAG TPA: hypothetical protein VH916_09895, partial [Dehalococcoidia bacterium]
MPSEPQHAPVAEHDAVPLSRSSRVRHERRANGPSSRREGSPDGEVLGMQAIPYERRVSTDAERQ